MVKHKKIFMEFFCLSPDEHVPCEFCHKAAAVDVHHCEMKGMGGNPSGDKDVIENLLGVCRACHDLLHSDPVDNSKAKLVAEDLVSRKTIMRRLMYGG